jgi:hypothetical protein
MSEISEFEWEPQPGLPAPLPPDENIIWQGSPNWLALAIDAFHVRKVAIYFGVLVALDLARLLTLNGADTEALLAGPALTLILCLGALTLLTSLAWLSASATIYTLTNKRLLIRFGIAIQLTINLPFKQIVAADLKERSNGTGNIPLRTADGNRVSYVVMWPHIRPWHFRKPQPMLRALPNARQVADLIAQAVRTNAAAGMATDTPRVETQAAPVVATSLDTAGA